MPLIVVVDYDPAWPHVFESLRARIQPVVADIALAIEHIGSTAVPGLAAKPIVDMVVVVPVDRVATAIDRLAGIGYAHKGDLGVPGREAFGYRPDTPRHHLYVCPVGNTGLANPLAVRDYLRAHPDAAAEYADVKRRLAVRFADDVDGYVEGKSAFILDVLRKSGFDETVLRDIERINRARRAGRLHAVAWRVATFGLIAWVYWRMAVHLRDICRDDAVAGSAETSTSA